MSYSVCLRGSFSTYLGKYDKFTSQRGVQLVLNGTQISRITAVYNRSVDARSSYNTRDCTYKFGKQKTTSRRSMCL